MNGREDKQLNDLFFVCSLIEYVGRQTNNERKTIVNALGPKGIKHYYELAEVYHCENINKVTHEIVTKYGITNGNYNSSMYYENTSYQYASYQAGHAL